MTLPSPAGLPLKPNAATIQSMATIAEVEKLALDLPEADRAALAEKLLQTLPPPDYDDADEIAEALRRDAEMDANPAMVMSMEEFRAKMRKLLE